MNNTPNSFTRTALDLIMRFLSPEPEKSTTTPTPPPAKKTIETMTGDELLEKRTRLDLEEQKVLRNINDLERQKTELFDNGVRKALSDREQMVIARRIKELEDEARNLDRSLQLFAKQRRIINGIMYIKRDQRMLESLGLQDIFSVDLAELQHWLSENTAQSETMLKKLEELGNTLESENGLLSPVKEDDEVTRIFQQMQRAREAAEPPLSSTTTETTSSHLPPMSQP